MFTLSAPSLDLHEVLHYTQDPVGRCLRNHRGEASLKCFSRLLFLPVRSLGCVRQEGMDHPRPRPHPCSCPSSSAEEGGRQEEKRQFNQQPLCSFYCQKTRAVVPSISILVAISLKFSAGRSSCILGAIFLHSVQIHFTAETLQRIMSFVRFFFSNQL